MENHSDFRGWITDRVWVSCAKKGLAQGATEFANSSVHTDNMHSLTHCTRKGLIYFKEKK